ncbi:hypothetical protein EXN66_Car002550 [Channa argus]|uniref:Uncharacterized protein n=1 Tax=Channa argus TaxID=215402 RepID=A0A6G1PA16_CHAAH|nr:hypothetical protein EXN66_Car002550 [Channa argus]
MQMEIKSDTKILLVRTRCNDDLVCWKQPLVGLCNVTIQLNALQLTGNVFYVTKCLKRDVFAYESKGIHTI